MTRTGTLASLPSLFVVFGALPAGRDIVRADAEGDFDAFLLQHRRVEAAVKVGRADDRCHGLKDG